MSNLSADQINNVQSLLQDMVAYLLVHKPEDPIPHMVQYLNEKKGKVVEGLSQEDRIRLGNLREQQDKLKKSIKTKARKSNAAVDLSDSEEEQAAKKGSESSGSDSEGEDEVVELPSVDQRKTMASKSRTSVSAEVFGKYHIKQAFVAKVVPKSDEVK